VLAVDMIEKLTKKLKYTRKIVLVTNGEALIDGDDLDEITPKLKECNIELVILYVNVLHLLGRILLTPTIQGRRF
jgi:ATP-dependent DNA helicase 2 subunit 2